MLEVKNGVGAQKKLFFKGVLISSGNREKIVDQFVVIRSVLDIAKVPHVWKLEDLTGSSNQKPSLAMNS